METILNKNITHLEVGDKHILLVGTAHVSRESTELVREVIEAEEPDTVCVELCQPRYQSIRQREQWQSMDIVKVIREKKAFLLLSNLLLASFQKRIAKKLDVQPGAEMLAAIEAAEATGATVHLADREIRVTLSRIWRILGFRDKARILFQMLLSAGSMEEISEEEIERMKQEDILATLLEDVGKELPVLKEILIDERDMYLAEKIRTAPGRKIVAVVGAGHVPGIRKHINEEIDLERLNRIPPGGRTGKIIKWGLPLLILVLFVIGFFFGGAKAGADMAILWIAANGIMAGVGAIIALAHPLTILSSIVAAPLTSLNPMVAAGWVSGLVEAFVKKPRVVDFENLSDDIVSVRGFWRNKVTRILLVVVFTNLGSSVGTFVAIPLMVRVFN